MKKEIVLKVHQIAAVLFADIESGKLALNLKGNYSLYTGQMGVVIFCTHYLQTYPNHDRQKVLYNYLETYFDELSSGMTKFAYCVGLSGVIDGLKYLNANKLLDIDFSHIESQYKPHLSNYAKINIARGNYDFLHGALGVLKCFPDDYTFINQAILSLENVAVKEDSKYKWVSVLGITEVYGYNICLSHGISSIVSVLSLLTNNKIDHNKRNEIITNSCNYILSQEIDHIKYGCFFPPQSLENDTSKNDYNSRLAWCYGDLGVATSLWQAGKVLNNVQLKKKALEVFTYASQLKTSAESKVVDAGVCHGAVGISMMFHYMYQQSGDVLFKDARNYWLNYTVKMGCFEDGLAGYKKWQGGDIVSWSKDYGLLEGISGIGLMLLTGITKDTQKYNWMNFFLLN